MKEELYIGATVETANFVLASTLFGKTNISPKRLTKCFEAVFFLHDGGEYCVNEKSYKVKQYDIRFLCPGDKVQSTAYNDIYVVHFTSDMPFLTDIPVKTSANEEIECVFKDICDCFAENNCVFVAERLFYLIRFLINKNRLSEPSNPVKAYIDSHYGEKITLSLLSEKFFLHPVYLERKFKNQTGVSVGEYIKDVRLTNAKRMLSATGLSSEKISYLCGFCNLSYFVRVFKEKYGITPGVYRKNIYSEIIV